MGRILKVGVGNVLVAVLTVARWVLGIQIVILDGLKDYLITTLLAVDVRGKPSARKERRLRISHPVLINEEHPSARVDRRRTNRRPVTLPKPARLPRTTRFRFAERSPTGSPTSLLARED